MTVRQVRTLDRNNVTAELTNALTDQNNEEIVSNVRYRYARTPDGEPYTVDVFQEITQYNNVEFTVRKYAGYNTYYRGDDIGSLGSTNIIITFKNPVPNFYITAVTETWFQAGNAQSGYPLGSINAYDSDDVVVKGIVPAFIGTSQPVTIDGVTRNVYLQNDLSDSVKLVNNKVLYQFSVENTSKRIKKVILGAPSEGSGLIYYQSIDWNRPVPPPIVNPISTQLSANQVNAQIAQQFNAGAVSGMSRNVVGYYGNQGYDANHTHGIEPNPHVHNITPDPHTHEITPNPHRHAMRFAESGSFVDTALENSCRVGPEVLINLIYNELNTETAKEKSRVSEAAKKGNWITANKLGKPIWDYLENYYIRRVICYLQARIWYTEYETLSIVPTNLDILPTGLIANYYGGNTTVVGALGQSTPATFNPPPQQPPPIDVNHLEPGQRITPFVLPVSRRDVE